MKRSILPLLLALCLALAAGCGGAAASAPAEPKACTYRTLPGVVLPEAEPRRVDWRSDGLGGSSTVTDPDDLREILALLDRIPIYDQPPDEDAARQPAGQGDTLHMDFFADPAGTAPDFSLTFRPCHIYVGAEVYGPFITGDAEEPLSRIAAIAWPTVPRSERHTLTELLGRPLPEGPLTIRTVAGPRGEEAFTPGPDTAAAIRRALAGPEYFTFAALAPQELAARCLYRLEMTGPGEEPLVLWLGEDLLVPEGGDYPEYIPYGDDAPLLALLAEETGMDFPCSLSFLQSLAEELYLLHIELTDPADLQAQRSFLAWQLDRMTGWTEPAETGEYRFPLPEVQELAVRRLGVEELDPLAVFADRLDRPERWSWYDTARREYVIGTPGGYGGAAAMEPIRREVVRDGDGALRSLRLRMGLFDLDLYYRETPERRLIGSYEVVFDFPDGDPENWRLVSAQKEEL